MPLPVISTDRTRLCPWQREDVEDLHDLWTLPEVRQFLWDDEIITRETAKEAVESHLEMVKRLGIGFWAVQVSEPLIAGFCGFRTLGEGPEIELLYGLRREHWGQGLATEACTAALECMWRATSFQRVYGLTDAGNDRSVRVLERLGMVHESTTDKLITYVGSRPGLYGSDVVTNTA